MSNALLQMVLGFLLPCYLTLLLEFQSRHDFVAQQQQQEEGELELGPGQEHRRAGLREALPAPRHSRWCVPGWAAALNQTCQAGCAALRCVLGCAVLCVGLCCAALCCAAG